jgi:O-antigen/teichoic acid export membrane protein
MNIFMDPGVNSVVMREIAKASDQERMRIFSASFVLKIILAVVGSGIVLLVCPYFSTLPGAKPLLSITALILTFDGLREFLASLIRAVELMEWDAGLSILTNVALVVFGFLYLYAERTAKSLAYGYAVGSTIGFTAALLLLRRYLSGVIRNFSFPLVFPLLRSAVPLAVTGALGALSTNADILIISWLRSASDVGVYSAAVRIIQVLYLLPTIFQVATLPIFSKLSASDTSKFGRALEKTICTILLVSIPIAMGGIMLGTGIMTLLFGEPYAGGAASFNILLSTIVIGFPGAVIMNALFAYGAQKPLIVASLIAAVSNVIFDFLLIPRNGIAGSAVATLLAITLSNGYAWYVMKKMVHFEVLKNLQIVIAVSIAVAVATRVLWILRVPVVFDIAAGAAIYLLALWILREPTFRDIRALAHQNAAPAETGSVPNRGLRGTHGRL